MARNLCAAVMVFCAWIAQAGAQTAGRLHLKPGAVVYGVVPPLFGKQPYKDVTAKLDDLKDLGVDVLWISPVHATDDMGAISYSITDYFKLREDFGSEADLKELIAKAHERDIKVLLDFVPNHTSKAHSYYADANERGTDSPYYNYYDRDSEGNPTFYFDWEHLPNLNYANTGVEDMISKAFRYWLRKLNIDGYRVDVAWGVRQRAPAFWKKMITQLRTERKDAVMIAEAPGRDSYYVENGFDAAYDWGVDLGQWAWKEAFDHPARAGQILTGALRANPNPGNVLRFLNNNDTGQRFITRYGEELTRAAAILQFSVPGLPLLFTGDEVGAEYEPYEDPQPVAWSDPRGFRDFYKHLLKLREDVPALHSGAIQLLNLNNRSVLSFIRRAPDGEQLLVMINFGGDQKIGLDLSPFTGAAKLEFTDIVSGDKLRFQGPVKKAWLKMKRFEARVLSL